MLILVRGFLFVAYYFKGSEFVLLISNASQLDEVIRNNTFIKISQFLGLSSFLMTDVFSSSGVAVAYLLLFNILPLLLFL